MPESVRTIALIVAAGKGERAGGDVPKQFAQLGGKALIAWSADTFAAHPAISGTYVVIAEGQQSQLDVALAGRKVEGIVIGGEHRHDSVRAGLEAIAAGGGADRVLIHDAARPRLSQMVINRLQAALDACQSATPALPCVDTLARRGGASGELLNDVVDRTELVRVQTPQAFHFEAILKAHRDFAAQTDTSPPTDDTQMARAAGMSVAIVDGDPQLEKITHAQDFMRAEAELATTRISRTAMGYDVHRLEAGEELWLGGVRVPHDKGLSGHSDADVALHALTDALLGTIAEGDIGSHFPPSDMQWRGAASHRFVEHARDMIAARGGIIDHVDVTIICEAPKIGPHRTAMQSAIASMLQIDSGRVSIKATTTERLGFTGRGEGIAAQAIATVRI